MGMFHLSAKVNPKQFFVLAINAAKCFAICSFYSSKKEPDYVYKTKQTTRLNKRVKRIFFHSFLKVWLLLISSIYVKGQPPCQNDPPILVGPSLLFVRRNNIPESISFIVSVQGIIPGDIEIKFPDNSIDTLYNISGNVNISHDFIFECGNMFGDPIPPNGFNHYYEYLIEVTRIDCVDPNGQHYKISPS